MNNVKHVLERGQSKKVLTKWRRYADDFDKHAEESEEEDDFDCIDTDDDDDQSDFFVRRPSKLETRMQRRNFSLERRPADMLKLKKSSMILTPLTDLKSLEESDSKSSLKSPSKVSNSTMTTITPMENKIGEFHAEKNGVSTDDSNHSDSQVSPPIVQKEPINNKRDPLEKPSPPGTKSFFMSREREGLADPTKSTGPKSKKWGKTRAQKSSRPKKEPNPRTALKYFPKEELMQTSSTNLVPALFGSSNTLGRNFSKEKFLSHYRDKFMQEYDINSPCLSGREIRSHSDLTMVTPMAGLHERDRKGSYILCEAKSFSPSPELITPSERMKNDEKIYELMRSPAVIIGTDISFSDIVREELSKASYAGANTLRDSSSPPSVTEDTDLIKSPEFASLSFHPNPHNKSITLPYEDAKSSPIKSPRVKLNRKSKNKYRLSSGSDDSLLSSRVRPQHDIKLNEIVPTISKERSSNQNYENKETDPDQCGEDTLSLLPLPKKSDKRCTDCRYLDVCTNTAHPKRRGSDTGSTLSDFSLSSDTCLPPSSFKPPEQPLTERVAEFGNQESLEEGATVNSCHLGFTVSKVKACEDSIPEAYDYDALIMITEPSPDTDVGSPDFESYLNKFYLDDEREIQTKSSDQASIIDSAISEENQAMIWSNLNEVKRVITNGENPLTWLMDKTNANTAFQSFFDSANDQESSSFFSNFLAGRTMAITDGKQGGDTQPSKWGGKHINSTHFDLYVLAWHHSNLICHLM